MKFTLEQTRELETLISGWCLGQGIASRGLVVHIEITQVIPLKVEGKIAKKKGWPKKATTRPLTSEEWQQLLSVSFRESMAEKVRLLQERRVDGLYATDFSGDKLQLQKFASSLNNMLRNSRLRFRFMPVKGPGNFGQYAMRTYDD